MGTTPHTERIECEELAVLAKEFRSTAERLRSGSYASRVTGRPTESVRLGTRAWAYEEAAQRCLEELQAGTARIVSPRTGARGRTVKTGIAGR